MGVRVLMVDDDKTLLEMAETFLEMEDPALTIHSTVSVTDSIAILETTEIDVIVSDFVMPEMDGLDFFRLLRERGIEIPFIIFTGQSREEVAIEALNLGIDFYVTKGGDPKSQYAELAHLIRNAYHHTRTERALIESEIQKSAILDAIEDMVAYYRTPELRIQWANRAALQDTGLEHEEIVGMHCYDVWHQKDEPCKNCPVVRAMKTGKVSIEEQPTPNGSIWLLTAYPIVEQDGTVSGVVEIGRNITKLRRLESIIGKESTSLEEVDQEHHAMTLRASNLYEKIIDNIVDGVWVANSDDVIIYANKSMVRIAGMPSSELIGSDILNDFGEETIKVFKKYYIEAKEKCEPTRYDEIQIITPAGRKTYQSGWIVPVLKDDKLDCIICTVEDVTENLEVKRALQESRERYKIIAETIPDGLIVVRDHRLVFVNDRALEIFGYPRHEFEHMKAEDFAVEDDKARFEGMLQRTLKKASEGKEVNSDISIWIERKDSSLRFIDTRHRLRKEADGSVIRYIIVTDMTEIIEAELIRRQNEELGQFAHQLKHDLVNSFHNLRGFIELLKDEFEPELLDGMIKVISHMEELTEKSTKLADAGLVIGQKENIDLRKLISDIIEETVIPGIEIELGEMPTVMGDCAKLRQAFSNMLQNAVEHGKPSLITIHSRQSATETIISVCNNGKPISEDIREKMFTERVSTKKGGGLGLEIVKKIVNAHGWTIRLADSSETCFDIIIPSNS